jgi:PAS domain S-box-containing protein
MLKAAPRRSVASAVATLADALLDDGGSTADIAILALDRLRRMLQASDAALWLVDGARLRRLLHTGERGGQDALPVSSPATAEALERLRRNRVVVRRHGEQSGLEHLVPDRARSFVAVSSTHAGAVTAVLVLAWDLDAPPHEETSLGQLRVAAALLRTAVETRTRVDDERTLAQAVFGALPDRVAVLDRDGVVIAANAAWQAFGHRHGPDRPAGAPTGASYLEVFRQPAAHGDTQAAAVLEGLRAVCAGTLDLFQASYTTHAPGEDGWWLMRATPVPLPSGGAVVVHTPMAHAAAVALGQRIGADLFQRTVDALPLAVAIVSPDGRVRYANAAWPDGGGASTTGQPWTAALHPSERPRADAELRRGIENGSRVQFEARVRIKGGGYCWMACTGTPRMSPDGTVERVLVHCSDVSARRNAESALDDLAAKLVAAQEVERARIARELHDDLGQQVAMLAMSLETLAQARQSSRHQIQKVLLDARTKLKELSGSIHSLSHSLHPAKLRLLGLVPTIEALGRDVAAESRVAVRVAAAAVPPDLADETSLCIFRIAQEALQNAVKHSGGRRVHIAIEGTGGGVHLTVEDDGVGFDPLVSQSAGLGLLTMRERAELVGGTLTVTSAPGRGTTIDAIVPARRRPR